MAMVLCPQVVFNAAIVAGSEDTTLMSNAFLLSWTSILVCTVPAMTYLVHIALKEKFKNNQFKNKLNINRILFEFILI